MSEIHGMDAKTPVITESAARIEKLESVKTASEAPSSINAKVNGWPIQRSF
jgi:hypothetical protein